MTSSHEVMKAAGRVQVTAALTGCTGSVAPWGEIGAVSVQWGKWK